ncbi:unnamed protein product, partial [Rotaria magnacalcarata]
MSGVLTTTGTPSTTRVWRYFFDRQPPLTKDENRECIGIYCSTIASLSVVFGIYLWSGLYHLKKYSIAPTIVLLAISFVLCLMIINWLTIGVYALIRQCHHHQQQQVKETSESNFGLTTPDKAKSFKVQFRGDLYKPNSKKLHINGDFNLGETSYNGKLSFERDDNHTRIELQRLFKLSQGSSAAGYEFFYERKTNKEATQNNCNIASHVSLRTPASDVSMKLVNLKTDFTRTIDLSNVTLQSSLDYLLVTRNPPVQETIEIDYTRRLVRATNQGKRLASPETNLKVQIHVVVDTDKLFPDIPRQFAFDVSSDLDFQLLNEVNYTFQYN